MSNGINIPLKPQTPPPVIWNPILKIGGWILMGITLVLLLLAAYGVLKIASGDRVKGATYFFIGIIGAIVVWHISAIVGSL